MKQDKNEMEYENEFHAYKSMEKKNRLKRNVILVIVVTVLAALLFLYIGAYVQKMVFVKNQLSGAAFEEKMERRINDRKGYQTTKLRVVFDDEGMASKGDVTAVFDGYKWVNKSASMGGKIPYRVIVNYDLTVNLIVYGERYDIVIENGQITAIKFCYQDWGKMLYRWGL